MYIKLEQYDYDAIAEIIAEQEDTYNGVISYSDLSIEIDYSKQVCSHREDDYYNGTGAWVTDSVEFSLGEVKCEGIEVKYSHRDLEKTIKEYLEY